MLKKFDAVLSFRRLVLTAVLIPLLLMGVSAQTRTVFTFDDKEEIPSYEVLKDRLDYISDHTVGEYRTAIQQLQDEKATALLGDISKVVIMIERLDNCPYEVAQSGWSPQQYLKLQDLIKKRSSIMRRLKKIQDENKRANRGSLFYLYDDFSLDIISL
jgi:hypothetical protein